MPEKWESVFQIFDNPDQPALAVRVLSLVNGLCHDFANRADAIAWIEGDAGAPAPLPMSEPTPEEIAEFERIEREVDEIYGPDGDPLADL
jgi:hypothetical protein